MSVGSAIGDLIQSIFDIFQGLLNGVIAVLHSILALGKDIIGAIIGFATQLIGFLMQNIVVIGVVVGAIFLWGAFQGGQKSSSRSKKVA